MLPSFSPAPWKFAALPLLLALLPLGRNAAALSGASQPSAAAGARAADTSPSADGGSCKAETAPPAAAPARAPSPRSLAPAPAPDARSAAAARWAAAVEGCREAPAPTRP